MLEVMIRIAVRTPFCVLSTQFVALIAMRTIITFLGLVAINVWPVGTLQAGDMTYGCTTRPACGKFCKLVCETKKLQAVGYGYKCESICIPGPSQRGCKHCDTTCCAGDDLNGRPPKIEFCWYDWFACGCATPRTVKVLTKYQAERKIDSYHWEVVDASCCDGVSQDGGAANDGCVYKPAPADAELGDVLAVSEQEWDKLAPMLNPPKAAAVTQVADQTTPAPTSSPPASPDTAPERISIAERLQGLLRK